MTSNHRCSNERVLTKEQGKQLEARAKVGFVTKSLWSMSNRA